MISTPLLLLALCGFHCVDAKEEFVKRVPNGDKVAGVKALGHVDPLGGGSSLNAFGEAFKAAGLEWTVDLCLADSDGDGQTNGQELGDPCCVWHAAAGPNAADIPTFSANVSNPSDAKDMVAAVILEQWVCGYQSSSSSEKEGQSVASGSANPSTQSTGSSFSAGVKSNASVPKPSATTSATGARTGVATALVWVVSVSAFVSLDLVETWTRP